MAKENLSNNVSFEEDDIFSSQEYKLVISYLQFIMNNKALLIDDMFKDDTEKIVNTDIKRLQIEDPELFGTYIVDGKPITYSRLVSHIYERPVLISEILLPIPPLPLKTAQLSMVIMLHSPRPLPTMLHSTLPPVRLPLTVLS